MEIKRGIDTKKIGELITGAPVYIVKRISLKDIEEFVTYIKEFPTYPYSEFSEKVYYLIEEIGKGKYILYKAFSPMEFRSVLEKGIDT